MIVSDVYDHQARLRSYQLIAEANAQIVEAPISAVA